MKKLAEHRLLQEARHDLPRRSPPWRGLPSRPGTNPARHNIFDFLDRDKRNYLPLLSSTHIGSVDRTLKIGSFRIPLEKPEVRLLRRSTPFWSILGEHNIWSTVLRVPITFPPDKFYGAQLSAMMRAGSAGDPRHLPPFLQTRTTAEKKAEEGGRSLPPRARRGRRVAWRGHDRGTRQHSSASASGENGEEVSLFASRFCSPIDVDTATGKAHHHPREDDDSGARPEGALRVGDPIDVQGRSGRQGVTGLSRLMVTEMGEHFSLYLSRRSTSTPENPAMPISHPSYYSPPILAKKIGPYSHARPG